ncbi:rho guanine nucleotide exchange factor 10-like protein isoform X2 [Mya arenaria]|uniref:rho guanine nucleotide exchange factor 10-like protein isoform X2 n=1 Tax=Mya arenaria TaxID=6604 RepID=UPI0022E087EC|nr:rho guanine nucleotide exchange factor 10-like protein isoform X2 [Mya arenaria]
MENSAEYDDAVSLISAGIHIDATQCLVPVKAENNMDQSNSKNRQAHGEKPSHKKEHSSNLNKLKAVFEQGGSKNKQSKTRKLYSHGLEAEHKNPHANRVVNKNDMETHGVGHKSAHAADLNNIHSNTKTGERISSEFVVVEKDNMPTCQHSGTVIKSVNAIRSDFDEELGDRDASDKSVVSEFDDLYAVPADETSCDDLYAVPADETGCESPELIEESPKLIVENIYEPIRFEGEDEVGKGFEVVSRSKVNSSKSQTGGGLVSKGSKSKRCSADGKKPKILPEQVNYEWKRKDAKKKSMALKRPSSLSKGSKENPLSQHGDFDDPNRGAFPEVTEELLGQVNPFNIHDHSDSASNISDFTDSTFDSDLSDAENREDNISEDYDPNRPLPPKPQKAHNHTEKIRDIANALLPEKKKKAVVQEVEEQKSKSCTLLRRVEPRRSRRSAQLPNANMDMSKDQIKLRGVLQNLIDSESGYLKSLERLTNDYKEEILSQVKKAEVKVTFSKVEDIYNLHMMFQIALSEKMEEWTEKEEIGSIFNMFSSPMTKSIYCEYVNNYEAANEMIKEAVNSRPSFKDLLLRLQMSSQDRLSLAGLMLKPVQRFPQFIMIVKDLLKYTPRDHHDREQLQEAFTCIENVTHELNESKRSSEQLYHGQSIMAKLAAKVPQEKGVTLIRQDDMEQIGQDVLGRFKFMLLNRTLIICKVSQTGKRDQEGHMVERFTYKWHQRLENLELTTSAITPNMYTKMDMKPSGTTISSPKQDPLEDDPYKVAEELTDMMHDITVLAKIHQLSTTLRQPYDSLSEDHLTKVLTNLQQQIQGKDYQLQMLNSAAIILLDRQRNKKYVFTATNAEVKQEWCIDFLLAKYALDIVNIPSWHRQEQGEESSTSQPALLIKHMSTDMQRTFTKIKCGVRVYFPTRTDGSVEHLWLWSSSEGQGQVSVVSLHTTKPALTESFQGVRSEVVCAESVPGFAVETDLPGAFPEDTVWTSTVDSEILVYSLSDKRTDSHRHPVYTFKTGCVVIVMRYVDDHVFCGNRSGVLIVYARTDAGVWEELQRIMLGFDPVTSLVCVGNRMWAACGNQIYSVNVHDYAIVDQVDHQLAFEDGERIHFNQIVKAGVGLWASFIGRPNIALYHSESRKLLQEFNICKAINEFILVYSAMKQERRDYEVTCLMASLGLLWVGTNIGIILAYPLPRLRDGIPRIYERPQVALHGHNGPVRFLIPVQYGPISGVPIRRRPESLLVKYKMEKDVLDHLPKMDSSNVNKRGKSSPQQPRDSYLKLGDVVHENPYEDIEMRNSMGRGGEPSHRESVFVEDAIYETLPGDESLDKTNHHNDDDDDGDDDEEVPDLSSEGSQTNVLETSSEHTYFILEKQDSGKLGTSNTCDTALKDESNGKMNEGLIEQTKGTESKNLDGQHEAENGFEVVQRRAKKPGKTQTMGPNKIDFAKELQKKVAEKRQSLDDLIDRDASRTTVELLYPTLARPKTLGHDIRPGMLEFEGDSSEENVYTRSGMITPIQARKPDYSSFRDKKKHKSPERSHSDKAVKISDKSDKDGGGNKKKTSVSFNEDIPHTKDFKKSRKASVGTSFTSGSNLDTLRKSNTNTILVLSGGDGYRDWKKRQSLNYRPEEPCLLFWMYKF